MTGETPDSIDWPLDLADDDASFEVNYTEVVMGQPFNENRKIPLRYLWEGVPETPKNPDDE